MICNKCKNKVKDDLLICPICGSSLKKKNKKMVKNKYIKEDSLNQVGGKVSNSGSFVNFKKKKVQHQIKRTDYSTYLDYQEAKEALEDQKLAKATKTKSKLLTNDVQNGSSFFSILKIEKVNKSNSINLKDYKNSLEESNNKKTGAQKAKIKYAKNSAEASIKSKREKDYNEVGNVVKTSRYDSELKDSNSRKVKERQDFYSEKQGKYFNYAEYINNKNNNINNAKFDKTTIKKKQKKIKFSDFLSYVAVMSIWVIVVFAVISYNNKGYYFGADKDTDEVEYSGVSKSNQVASVSGLGVTSIIYDNQYLKQMQIDSLDDVNELIVSDSVKQKANCPKDSQIIENEIINHYGVTAVNFCEIDSDLARELRNVVAYIYNEFPNARNYLTNITIANVGQTENYIAAFMPVFTFATSPTNSGYPVGIKTQIILNARYFLNPSKLKNSVSNGANSGYFPANASSSSAVAHEFGHYLSYVAMLNYYKSNKLNYVRSDDAKTLYSVYTDFNEGNFSYKLLQEAYQKYQNSYLSVVSFDEFRESISGYAMAKDNKGKYIYDETIAEAFHDYYLNGENAKPASKTIVEVLISKL